MNCETPTIGHKLQRYIPGDPQTMVVNGSPVPVASNTGVLDDR